jgi:hypothetical protein
MATLWRSEWPLPASPLMWGAFGRVDVTGATRTREAARRSATSRDPEPLPASMSRTLGIRIPFVDLRWDDFRTARLILSANT